MKKCIFLFMLGCLSSCVPTHFLPNSSSSVKDEHYREGNYRGSYYIVNEGDTLHYIAYLTDKNINDIIHINRLLNPDQIYPGQKLNLWHRKYLSPAYGDKQFGKFNGEHFIPDSSTSSTPSGSLFNNKQEQHKKKPNNKKHAESTEPKPRHTSLKQNTRAHVKASNYDANLSWQWPTKGPIISHFSNENLGNKGIDIAGRKGQEITSSANGKVVYAGSALRGYGNLIIIKHNENYLSAYAHNDRLLVSENQRVKKGQKIATMGSSGATSVRLHFEIRYKGKSVNPNRYLPSI